MRNVRLRQCVRPSRSDHGRKCKPTHPQSSPCTFPLIILRAQAIVFPLKRVQEPFEACYICKACEAATRVLDPSEIAFACLEILPRQAHPTLHPSAIGIAPHILRPDVIWLNYFARDVVIPICASSNVSLSMCVICAAETAR